MVRKLSLFLALTLALSTRAEAVPLELTHQGRLLDDAGTPLEGSHEVSFRLYTEATGGSAVWSETYELELDNGYFAATLGEGGTLEASLFDEGSLYLGLAIDDGEELPQRHQLVSVPFAIRARTAQSVDGGVVNASELYINGTPLLDSDGDIAVGGTLGSLDCLPDEVAVYDGVGWACGENVPAHEHAAAAITTGTIDADRLPVGTGDDDVAAGSHGHALGDLTGTLDSSQLPADLTLVAPDQACADGEVMTGIDADGKVVCAAAASGGPEFYHVALDLSSLQWGDSTGAQGTLSGYPTPGEIVCSDDDDSTVCLGAPQTGHVRTAHAHKGSDFFDISFRIKGGADFALSDLMPSDDARRHVYPCWGYLTGDAEGTTNDEAIIDATGFDVNGGHSHTFYNGYSMTGPTTGSDPVFSIQTRTKAYGSHEVFAVTCIK